MQPQLEAIMQRIDSLQERELLAEQGRGRQTPESVRADIRAALKETEEYNLFGQFYRVEGLYRPLPEYVAELTSTYNRD